MAVGLAPAFANSILDAIGNNTDPGNLPIAAFWIQLHTAEPGSAGTTAVAGNATRKQVSFGAAAGGVMSNDTAITWTTGEVDTAEDYTHWSAFTASTAGTFIQSGTMTANAVQVGNEFTIPIGDLDITLNVAT